MAWSLATGAAVTLSWWGVHTVMAGTAYDPPQALPIPTGPPARGATARSGESPSSSLPTRRSEDAGKATGRPERSASPPATAADRSTPPPSRTPSGSAGPSGAGSPSPSPSRPSTASESQVKSYTTEGGRVTFDLGKTSAKLVSATPATGWSMQVWKDPSWIRVEFTAGAAAVSVFCTWHDHEPTVEIVKS
ncbi:hypothetical protein GCM10010446_48370 [Streptomyces enissocaesilis]|uniref:Secreted protein n=1 Tax=Streptomyces enissocaesilis TaxID=332589 RepID=A0ABN3XHU1_9ACTN